MMPNEVPQLWSDVPMPTARKLLAALALAITAVSCSDDKSPTSPATDNQPASPQFQKASKLFKNIPVTGTTADGRTVRGKVTITRFGVTPTGGTVLDANGVPQPEGQLTVSGKFQLEDGGVTSFTNVPAALVQAAGTAAPTAAMDCSILDLDIGAIHLDLLGLVVDLAPIHLDITGDTGAGNLLGNLLCGLAGILDPGGLTGLLSAISDLIDQINDILAGL
jgi:hypothetical protein